MNKAEKQEKMDRISELKNEIDPRTKELDKLREDLQPVLKVDQTFKGGTHTFLVYRKKSTKTDEEALLASLEPEIRALVVSEHLDPDKLEAMIILGKISSSDIGGFTTTEYKPVLVINKAK